MLVNKATCGSKRSRSLRSCLLYRSWRSAHVCRSSFHHYFIKAQANFHRTISNQFKNVLRCFVISATHNNANDEIRVVSFRIFSFQMNQQIAPNFEPTSKKFYSPSYLHRYVSVLFTVVVVTSVDAASAAIITTFRYELKSRTVGPQI